MVGVNKRMRRGFLVVILLASFAALAQAQETDLQITGVTLIDGTGTPPQEAMTIVVRDGRIEAIVPDGEAEIPDGAKTIEAAGKYVIPGLADMHVHFSTGGFVRDEHTVERVLRQFLFYGVTTVFNLGATGGNLSDIRVLRQAQAAGHLLAPRIYATGGLITVPGSHPIATIMQIPEGVEPSSYDWTQRGIWVLETPEQVREVVAQIAEAGLDGVKLVVESGPTEFGDHHPQMPPALIEAAVDEARQHGLPVFSHASSIDEVEDAIEAGVRGIVHLVSEPGPPSPNLLAAMEEKEVFFVPTLALVVWADSWGEPSESLTDPFLLGVEARVIQSLLESPLMPTEAPRDEDWSWRRLHLQALKVAHDAQIKVATGTDTGNPTVFPGYSMHHELELMVEAGLTPMEALVAATRRPAEMLRKEDTFGTIKPGMPADLLLLTANPLEDIRNTRKLEAVIQGGRIIDRSTLLSK